jgi:hypothetical protein
LQTDLRLGLSLTILQTDLRLRLSLTILQTDLRLGLSLTALQFLRAIERCQTIGKDG